MGFFSNLANAFTGKDSAKAARKGAQAQEAGFAAGQGEIRSARDEAQGFLGQFAESGQGANDLLMNLLGINGPEAQQSAYTNFQNPPGFQEAVDFGNQNAMQSGVNFGNLRSGSTLKSLQGVGQRAKYGALQDWMDRLTGQQGQGINVAGRQGDISTSSGNALAGLSGDIGNARASGIVGAQNAKSSAGNNILKMISGGVSALGGGFLGKGGGSPQWQTTSWDNPYG